MSTNFLGNFGSKNFGGFWCLEPREQIGERPKPDAQKLSVWQELSCWCCSSGSRPVFCLTATKSDPSYALIFPFDYLYGFIADTVIISATMFDRLGEVLKISVK
jgi:hypothetical protein